MENNLFNPPLTEETTTSTPTNPSDRRATPGSMIPKRKPPAIVAAMAAEKIKRRSVQLLRRNPLSTANNGASGTIAKVFNHRPAAASSQSIRRQQPPATQPRAAVTTSARSSARSVANTSRNNAPSMGRGGPARPGPSTNNPPRSAARAAAEQAVQKRPRFVTKFEQQLERQLQQTTQQNSTLKTRLNEIMLEKDGLVSRYEALEARAIAEGNDLARLRMDHAAALAQLRGAQLLCQEQAIELGTAKSELAQVQNDRDHLRASFESQMAENARMVEKVWRGEVDRRRLHNAMMELKGNIRVFCRVRPILSNEFGLVTILENVKFTADDDKLVEIRKPIDANNLATPIQKNANNVPSVQSFEFDKVFGPEATQLDVFEEISQLVQSAVDGYNVCIFAYGQTGSGKTFTMEGPPPMAMADFQQQPFGMIELSIRKIFETVDQIANLGWQYTVEASFVEIYNEMLLDLLTKDHNKRTTNESLEIRLIAGGGGRNETVDVPGLTKIIVRSSEELKPLLRQAQTVRAWAATKCNDHSSRSHSVFRLRLCGTNKNRGGMTVEGVLNLVDLAGSENVKKAESSGAQLREAQNINTSLMTLGKVITSLGNGAAHVPYRDSKLTYLLKNSLAGNSKCLMFVNISPEDDCVNESLNSLRFATMVNQCHVGTAKKNVAVGGKTSSKQ